VDGVNTCTTDLQPWSATRDSQPTQTTTALRTAATPPSIGHRLRRRDPITFTVAGSGRDIENVSLQTTTLYCTETTATQSQFALGQRCGQQRRRIRRSMVSDAPSRESRPPSPTPVTGDFEGHGISGIERAAGPSKRQ